MQSANNQHVSFGVLALDFCGKRLPLIVLQSAAGFYIGTMDSDGPVSRESCEYFPSIQAAHEALRTGNWTQKDEP